MLVLRPTDEEIKSVLEERSTGETAEKVALWLATEDGRDWFMHNSQSTYLSLESDARLFEIPSDEILEKIHERVNRMKRQKMRSRLLWTAAAVLTPIAVGLLMLIYADSRIGHVIFRDSSIVTESAEMGERKEVIFQDGTKVYLNAGATISYPEFWGFSERKIRLEGEAFFKVAKDDTRPFIVEVLDCRVRVCGTSFNMRAYPKDDNISVVLLEGKVIFESAAGNYVLNPSDCLSYNIVDKKVDIVRLSRPDNAVLWTNNILSFKNAPLAEVLSSLERWYGVSFVVSDDTLCSRAFTFRTTQLPLRSLLDEMEYVSDLKFEIKGDEVVVSGKF